MKSKFGLNLHPVVKVAFDAKIEYIFFSISYDFLKLFFGVSLSNVISNPKWPKVEKSDFWLSESNYAH